VDQSGGRLDQAGGFFLGVGLGDDPEADGGLGGGNPDLGDPAPGGQVERLGLDLGLALAEQVDLPVDDPAGRQPRLAEPGDDLLLEHPLHLVGDARQARHQRPSQRHRDPRRGPDGVG